MNHRIAFVAAGILGATGVGLGAFGAHGLREILLQQGMANTWETAARYQLFHAVALVGVAAWLRQAGPAGDWRAAWAARCWVAGVIVFSGSLYALALGGPRWLGPVTPLGGLALLAGWCLLIASGLARPGESDPESSP